MELARRLALALQHLPLRANQHSDWVLEVERFVEPGHATVTKSGLSSSSELPPVDPKEVGRAQQEPGQVPAASNDSGVQRHPEEAAPLQAVESEAKESRGSAGQRKDEPIRDASVTEQSEPTATPITTRQEQASIADDPSDPGVIEAQPLQREVAEVGVEGVSTVFEIPQQQQRSERPLGRAETEDKAAARSALQAEARAAKPAQRPSDEEQTRKTPLEQTHQGLVDEKQREVERLVAPQEAPSSFALDELAMTSAQGARLQPADPRAPSQSNSNAKRAAWSKLSNWLRDESEEKASQEAPRTSAPASENQRVSKVDTSPEGQARRGSSASKIAKPVVATESALGSPRKAQGASRIHTSQGDQRGGAQASVRIGSLSLKFVDQDEGSARAESAADRGASSSDQTRAHSLRPHSFVS